MGILIGTALLWIANVLVVLPFARFLQQRMALAPASAGLDGEMPGDADQQELGELDVRSYVLADVLVLGLAGLCAGLAGFWFVGVAFEAKGWPGMLTLIGACFLGLALAGHR